MIKKYVKSNRLHARGWFAALALGCFSLSGHAFEQLTPPAGWSAGGGPGGSVTGTKTAVNAAFSTGGVSSNASIRASGRLVTIPALMQYTANAPRVAAAAIMLHPGIRTAASIAGWLGLAGLLYDPISGLWTTEETTDVFPSDGYEYSTGTSFGWHQSREAACQAYVYPTGGGYSWAYSGLVDGACVGTLKSGNNVVNANHRVAVSRRGGTCPSGWYVTAAGCVQTPPLKTVTQEQAVEELTKHPMPADVPKHIPEPLPVDMPFFEPIFIPTGNPVANPKYDPSAPASPENQPFVQPGTKVSPAPSPDAPWQVDVVPVNRPTPTPEGSTQPTPEPAPETPREDGKDDRDFCDKNPKALACVELDTPDQDVPRDTVNISYQYADIFGNGACPADAYLSTHGQNLKVWDWQNTCQNVRDYFRPVLIACCAFAAFLIISAGVKE